MRRAAIGAGFVVALTAITAGSVRWPVSPGWVAASLNAAYGRSRLLSWGEPQAATFSVLPWPSLVIVDARLDSASGANIVSSPEARVDLSPLELVLGQIAAAHVSLDSPTITFDLDRTPFVGRLGAADAMAALNGFAPLGSVNLTNGVVRVLSRKRGLDTVIESVRGRFDGLSPASTLIVDMSAVWRGGPLILSGSLDEPRRAAHGKPSAVKFAFQSPLADLTFAGALAAGAAPGAAGTVTGSSHALAEVFRLLGAPAPRVLGADVAISGRVKASPEDVTFDEATVTTGGQTVQGALRLTRSGGRLAISGSLDAERLSLAPLMDPPEPLLAPDGGWSRTALFAAPSGDFDLDLRLSVGLLDVFGVGLDNVAASVLLKDGALTANLVDATAYGGRGQGVLHLACDDSATHITARGKLAGADFGPAASQFGWSGLTGAGDAEFSLETDGRTPAELIAALGGAASIALAGGAVSDFNLEEALRRSRRRPLDVSKDMRSGGTAFDRATLNLLIGKGVAHIVNAALLAHGLRADVQGGVDLGSQTLNLRLNAAQTEPTGLAAPDAPHLSVVVNGPWSNPTIQPVDETDGAQPDPSTTAP